MKLFKCRVCEEKDRRIVDLKSQLDDLRRLVLPPNHSAGFIHPISVEADAILSGQQEPITLSPEQEKEFDELQREADAILAGNY
jgi:hypothetical protein